jgi:hypothetical protein
MKMSKSSVLGILTIRSAVTQEGNGEEDVDKHVPSQKNGRNKSGKSDVAKPVTTVVICNVEHEQSYSKSHETGQDERQARKAYPIFELDIKSPLHYESIRRGKGKDHIFVQSKRQKRGNSSVTGSKIEGRTQSTASS